MREAMTEPDGSSIVIVPAAPPFPIDAMLPLIQAWFVAPSDQFTAVALFQLPLPSAGVATLAPLASQVTVCACTEPAHSAATIGAIASTPARRPRCEADRVALIEAYRCVCRRTCTVVMI